MHFLLGSHRIHLLLHTDGFKKNEPIQFNDKFNWVTFQLENRAGRAHPGSFELSGLPDGDYEIQLDGRRIDSVTSSAGVKIVCNYRIGTEPSHAMRVVRLH